MARLLPPPPLNGLVISGVFFIFFCGFPKKKSISREESQDARAISAQGQNIVIKSINLYIIDGLISACLIGRCNVAEGIASSAMIEQLKMVSVVELLIC